MEKIKRENHIIDAKDKVLGRLATKVAILLRGKDKPGFALNKDMGDFVTIKNCDETNTLKFKKAEALLAEGWEIVSQN